MSTLSSPVRHVYRAPRPQRLEGLEGFTEVSEILRAGVYALVAKEVVIYVGKSKNVYARLYAHRSSANRAARGQQVPTWMPIKGFVFDRVFVKTCRLEELDELEKQMIAKYRPKFNFLHKPMKGTQPLPFSLRVVPKALLGIERRM